VARGHKSGRVLFQRQPEHVGCGAGDRARQAVLELRRIPFPQRRNRHANNPRNRFLLNPARLKRNHKRLCVSVGLWSLLPAIVFYVFRFTLAAIHLPLDGILSLELRVLATGRDMIHRFFDRHLGDENLIVAPGDLQEAVTVIGLEHEPMPPRAGPSNNSDLQ
jgi:hypothetical protein